MRTYTRHHNGEVWIIGIIAVLSLLTLLVAILVPKLSQEAQLFLIGEVFALLVLIVRGIFKR